MRVLHLTSDYPPDALGGLGTHVFELAKGLEKNGAKIIVACPSAQDAVERESERLVLRIATPAEKGRTSGGSQVEAILRWNELFSTILKERLLREAASFDLVHGHDWHVFRTGKELAQNFGVPFVGSVHQLYKLWRWSGEPLDAGVVEQEMLQFRSPAKLITVSHSMMKQLEMEYGIDPSSVEVIHNGFDNERFRADAISGPARDSLRSKIGPEHQTIVLFCGRTEPQKGIEAVFDAAQTCARGSRHVTFVIAGSSNSRRGQGLMQILLARHDGLVKSRRIQWLKKLSRKQVSRMYSVADIAIVPSVYEPFGYAVVEAMAHAVPVIATASGGPEEIPENGNSGFLLEIEVQSDGTRRLDGSLLGNIIAELAADPERARTIGQKGQSRAERFFTDTAMGRATLDTYEKLLKERVSAGGS